MSTEAVDLILDRDMVSRLQLACFTASEVRPDRPGCGLDEVLCQLTDDFRRRYKSPAGAAERIRPARILYRALGVDPTRYRPSSEALLRRILLGKGLYRINSVVDTANLCSLEMALPVGLYDLERIEGRVICRMGRSGEGYDGIGKARINLEGRPGLFDGVSGFGNPSSDSFRTRIRESTRSILFVIFAPVELERAELSMHLDRSARRMTELCGGEIIRMHVFDEPDG